MQYCETFNLDNCIQINVECLSDLVNLKVCLHVSVRGNGAEVRSQPTNQTNKQPTDPKAGLT